MDVGAWIRMALDSREFRIFGSISSAPPSGGAKWPIADSYALRTSMITVSGCARDAHGQCESHARPTLARMGRPWSV
jgi:hypothetical protein